MKKWLAAISVLAVLMIFTMMTGALADKPVNPVYLDRGMKKPLTPRSGSYIEVTIDAPEGIHYGPTTWTFSAEGGVAPYTYTVQLCTFEMEQYTTDDLYTTVYVTDYEEDSITVDILVPGEYWLFVTAEDSEGYYGDNWECYDLAEDSAHPSIGKIAASLARKAMSAGSDDYSRALWAHDYIINNAYYDYDYYYYGADGVLLRGKGVCDSYSKALTMILQECGISAGRVIGGNHAWVIARLDGEWYMIDPTWDDPNTKQPDAVSGYENYDYFCITTEMLCYDHTIEEYDPGYDHLCVSLEDNYYYRNGYGEFWVNDVGWPGDQAISEQLVPMLEKPGLEMLVEVPKHYRYDGSQNRWYSGSGSSIWPVAAYAMSRMQWEVNGVTLPLDVHYDYASRMMVAKLDLEKLPCVKLPTNLTRLDEGAFAEENSMLYAAVPEGVTAINADTFADCGQLRCVDLPASVTSIDAAAFAGSPLVSLRAPAGSFAEGWAAGAGIPFAEK